MLVVPFDVELDEDGRSEHSIHVLGVRHDFVQDDVDAQLERRERQALLLGLLLLIGRVAVAVVRQGEVADFHQVRQLETDRAVEMDGLAELHLCRFSVGGETDHAASEH